MLRRLGLFVPFLAMALLAGCAAESVGSRSYSPQDEQQGLIADDEPADRSGDPKGLENGQDPSLVMFVMQGLGNSMHQQHSGARPVQFVLMLYSDGLFVSELRAGSRFGLPQVGRLSDMEAMHDLVAQSEIALGKGSPDAGAPLHSDYVLISVSPRTPASRNYVLRHKGWQECLNQGKGKPPKLASFARAVANLAISADEEYSASAMEAYPMPEWVRKLLARDEE